MEWPGSAARLERHVELPVLPVVADNLPEQSGCKAFKPTVSERFVDWLAKVSVFPPARSMS